MRNPTPAPIVVPASGAPTCRGVALRTVDLRDFERDGDSAVPGDHYDLVRVWAGRAVHNGHVLCLRPTVVRPACVGLTATMFADASLQSGFEARALVVDPYDADGADIREAPRFRIGQRVRLTVNSQNPVTGVIHLAKGAIGTVTRQAWKANEDPNSEIIVQWEGADRPLRTFMGVVEAAPLTPEEAHSVAVWEASEAV